MGGVDGKRKLDNWLDGFLKWTIPRSETPTSMLRWMGLCTLSAVMKRKVWWPRELLGGYEIYPNLYVILVGEPAVVRKSTTIGFAENLLTSDSLKGNDRVNFSGDITSHSKLLDALTKAPDSSLAIMSGEFSSLIQTTPESMYEILTDLFDNKSKIEWSTWAHGDKKAEKPVVNLTAATTPAWISSQPPEYFIGGGFASRVIFLYEEGPRQREIYYDHLSWKQLKFLESALKEDLAHIASLKGPFSHDSDDTKEYVRSWYKEQSTLPEDPRMKGFHGRKHVHAHKVATLLSIAERDDRKITKAHWDEALKHLNYVEKKMPQVFTSLGTNPFAIVMEQIQAYVALKGKASLRDIAGRFYKEGLTLEQLKSALTFLCTAQEIKAEGSMANPVYVPNKKKGG